MIERKTVNAVHHGELGEGLEGIPFNLSDSIMAQISEENERIHSLLGMRTFHAIFSHLLQCLKLREILERIRFNEGNLVIVQLPTTDDSYDGRTRAMLSEERASN